MHIFLFVLKFKVPNLIVLNLTYNFNLHYHFYRIKFKNYKIFVFCLSCNCDLSMEGQNGTSEELFSLIETGTYQIKSKLKGQPIKEEILPITSFHKSIENESTENKENEEEKKIAKFSRYRPEEAFEAEIHQVDFHKLMKKPEVRFIYSLLRFYFKFLNVNFILITLR